MSEDHNARAGQGPVVLDVGGDVGALIVLAPESLAGGEIEAVPLAPDRVDHASHAAVLRRDTGAGTTYCAVIGELTAGRYALHRLPDGPIAVEVEVRGGEISQALWPVAVPDRIG